ncbi:MAG TPA: hypothetical protein VMC05_08435 [Xanthobacteraceae bacterium]|nr:hypothetical protein [Xanthobacteraceae bacterium]
MAIPVPIDKQPAIAAANAVFFGVRMSCSFSSTEAEKEICRRRLYFPLRQTDRRQSSGAKCKNPKQAGTGRRLALLPWSSSGGNHG